MLDTCCPWVGKELILGVDAHSQTEGKTQVGISSWIIIALMYTSYHRYIDIVLNTV